MGRLRTLKTVIGAAIAVAVLAAPGSAAATVTVTGYSITSNLPPAPTPPSALTTPSPGPSSFQAGANPDAGSYSTFAYGGDPAEDLKTARTNFAAGLLGNPESVPKCSEAALQAGGTTCPAASRIGTSRLDIKVAGSSTPAGGFNGFVYNAELLGNEPGRLGVVTFTGATTFLVSSIPFYITPRGNGDYGLTGVLDNVSELDTSPFGNLQVHALSFILNGSTNSYVRNPTSCGLHISTGDAAGYVDPTFNVGPEFGFNTIGCDTVPFNPSMSIEMGDAGSTGNLRYPPVVIKITQPNGDADQLGNKLTLPVELNSNNGAYKTCTQAQADADACPANSRFGGVVAKSPFLGEELKGPVYLIQQPGVSLPGLLLDLNGRVHVKIQTKTSLIGSKRIQSLVLNAPQLPVSELRIALDGGRTTGVFQNRADLCFRGKSTSKFNDVSSIVKFYGHNGKNSSDTTFDARVNGCGPGVTGSISGATSIRPTVRLDVQKHPDAPNFKELRVTLSNNLSLVEGKVGGGVTGAPDATFDYIDPHTLQVSGLPAAGEDAITLSLHDGAVRVSDRSQELLERGRSRKFSAKVKQTPVSGKATSTRAKFTAKSNR